MCLRPGILRLFFIRIIENKNNCFYNEIMIHDSYANIGNYKLLFKRRKLM